MSEQTEGAEGGLTLPERRLLADRVLGGAEPSSLMVSAVETIVVAREAAAEARGAERALRDLTHEWQFKGWADVVPGALNSAGIPALAVGQAVTDWLRARATVVAARGAEGGGGE